MPGFNDVRVKWSVAGIVLLLLGFAGGYKLGLVRMDPFRTVAAYPTGPGGCPHDLYSIYHCPGTKDLAIAGDRLFVSGDSITIGAVSVRYRGSTYVLPIPKNTDAIFFTPKAVQILIEHYQATNEPTKVTELQELLRSYPKP